MILEKISVAASLAHVAIITKQMLLQLHREISSQHPRPLEMWNLAEFNCTAEGIRVKWTWYNHVSLMFVMMSQLCLKNSRRESIMAIRTWLSSLSGRQDQGQNATLPQGVSVSMAKSQPSNYSIDQQRIPDPTVVKNVIFETLFFDFQPRAD